MGSPYVKSWRRSAFKERNDKICRLRAKGMELNILCKRFGLSWMQLKTILKEGENG
jgi:lambda repressor-like predicted transcriptional regulator